VVVPHPARWHGKLAAALVFGLIRSVDATLRYDLRNPSGSLAAALEAPVIFAIWHNRLALCLMLYRRYVQRARPARKLAALVSASRDGGLLARVLEHFGVQPVRGSSSRRGAQAMLELTSWAARGYDLAVTPDGPRGPRYAVQEGVIAAAQLTGLAVLPVSYRLGWKYQLDSWDRFQIPAPLGRCTVQLGDLLRVPRELSDADREARRRDLEARLQAITVD
jgi:lysophospholipid acyltransferase (LPLAT)-like uncharacterized protein